MLYKLIIAEDEETIRRGLAKGFDWAALGFEVCGLAGNAAEALRLMDEVRPDVLLTDIKMPGASGLDLLEQASLRHPDLETVVLTGYAQFDYAQRALALHAFDYVLKIDVAAALEPAMQRLREHLDAVRAADGSASGQDGAPNEVIRYIHEHYAENITMDGVARHFYMSTSHFCRQFKKTVGKGFNSYLRDYRLEIARQMLKSTDLRVSEVAARVGYSNSRYFSELFSEKYGVLPSGFRREKK